MTAPPDSDVPSPADEVRAMTRRALRAGTTQGAPGGSRAAARPRMPFWLMAALVFLPLAGVAVIVAGFRAGPPQTFVVSTQNPLADEPALLAAAGPGMQVFRLQPAPRIRVLIFGSLTLQGRALNRIGAFVEKAGMPHDRVVDDAELARAFARDNESAETYYYGHDYKAADLARFYSTADADHVVLGPEEIALRQMLQREGLLSPGAVGAIISLPPPGDDGIRDAHGRAAILRHEISHGVYFTDPVYAAFVQRFWETVMDAGERDKFRHFLGADGYDTGNDDLIRNETQAYLVFTPDRRFFTAAAVGLTDAEAAALQQRFLDAMPVAWLKERALAATGSALRHGPQLPP